MKALLTDIHFDRQAQVLKAMGHVSRLKMVHALAQGERCVCELQELVGHDMSTVSKHLSVLKKAGILEDEKRGKQVYYRLRIPCVLSFFDCLESVMEADRAGS